MRHIKTITLGEGEYLGYNMGPSKVFGRHCENVILRAGETVAIRWYDYYAILGVQEDTIPWRMLSLYQQAPRANVFKCITGVDDKGKPIKELYLDETAFKKVAGRIKKSKSGGMDVRVRDRLKQMVTDGLGFTPELVLKDIFPQENPKAEIRYEHPDLPMDSVPVEAEVMEKVPQQADDHRYDSKPAVLTEGQMNMLAPQVTAMFKEVNERIDALKADLGKTVEHIVGVALGDALVRKELGKAILETEEAQSILRNSDALFEAHWKNILTNMSCIAAMEERVKGTKQYLYPVIWDMLMMEFDCKNNTTMYTDRKRCGDECMSWKLYIQPKGVDYVSRLADFIESKRACLLPSC